MKRRSDFLNISGQVVDQNVLDLVSQVRIIQVDLLEVASPLAHRGALGLLDCFVGLLAASDVDHWLALLRLVYHHLKFIL